MSDFFACACCGGDSPVEFRVEAWGGVCRACDLDIKVGLAETHADYPDSPCFPKHFGAEMRAKRRRRLANQELADTWRESEGISPQPIRDEIEAKRQRRVDWVEARREKRTQARRRA